MRILVAEDDPQIGAFLKSGLEEKACAVDLEKDGARASWRARTNEYDILLLDHNLPNQTGQEICRELRASGRNVPIIMLTIESETNSKVAALNIGADDYLTKPFSFEELFARIQANLRRPRTVEKRVIKFQDLELDTSTQDFFIAGELIHLTRKEFQLLELLMRNPEKVVSRAKILEHVWDAEGDPFSNTIETHVSNLRRKIENGRERKYIHAVPGRGYKLA